jgi:hypothetical protein
MVKSVTKPFVFGTLVIDNCFQNRWAQFSFVSVIKKVEQPQLTIRTTMVKSWSVCRMERTT